MKKSIFTLFLIFCSIFCCVGCQSSQQTEINQTNAFRIIRQTSSSGEISITYIFPLNTAFFEDMNVADSEIKIYQFYLATYINALAEQYRQKATDGVQVSGCTYFSNVDGIGFSIVFDDLESQKTFFGSDDSENETQISTTGFFVKKMEMTINFPLSTESAENLKLICSMAIQSWCSNSGLDSEEYLKILDDSSFIYDYATTSTTLNSDITYDDENFHHNVFIKTLAEIEEDGTITFYTSYINTPIWYLTALLLVIVGMFVAYVVLRNRKINSKETK